MQLSDLYGDNPLELILLIMLLVYFPYAMYQLYLIVSDLHTTAIGFRLLTGAVRTEA